jgi:uncharacterized protein
MELEYDPDKRRKTLVERDLDFADAIHIFERKHFTAEDLREGYNEQRFITVGKLDDRMVVLVWTPREQTRRIISMRKANEREQKRYDHLLD